MRLLTWIIPAKFPDIPSADYIELVGRTGKCAQANAASLLLGKVGLDSAHWSMKVKGIGCGYWRAVDTATEPLQEPEDMGQHWLCGFGLARLI